MTVVPVTVNNRRFNRLPKEVQDIFIEVGRDMEAKAGPFTTELVAKILKVLKEKGVKIVSVSDSEREAWSKMLVDEPAKIAKKFEAESKLPVTEVMKAYIAATESLGHKWPRKATWTRNDRYHAERAGRRCTVSALLARARPLLERPAVLWHRARLQGTAMRKFLLGVDALTKAMMIFTAFCALGIAFLILVEVFARNAGLQFYGAAEYIRNFLIVIVFLQLPFAIRVRGMLVVDIFVDSLPKRAAVPVSIVGDFLGLLFFGAVAAAPWIPPSQRG